MKDTTMEIVPHAALGFRTYPDPQDNPSWATGEQRPRAGIRPKGRTERTTRPKGRRRSMSRSSRDTGHPERTD